MPGLFDPVRLGGLELRNRIAMAPCTRCMSPRAVPTDDVAAYYERRAQDGVGLLEPFHLVGPPFERFVLDQVEAFEELGAELGLGGGGS